MASTINADDGVVSGSAGVKTSADNSGVLELQSNGTTQFTLGSSSVVINEAGADVDFRVEGDTDSNLLFVDASTDRVGVGTGTPGFKFEVVGGVGLNTSGTSVLTTFGANNNTDKYLRIRNSDGNFEIGSASAGHYLYGTGSIPLQFFTNGNERARLDASGNLLVGTTSTTVWNGGAGTKFLMDGSGNTIISLQSSTTTADQGGIVEALSTAVTAGSKALGSIAFLRENTSTTALNSYTGFYTNNAGTVAERARINAKGFLKLRGSESTYATSDGYEAHDFNNGTSDRVIIYSRHTAASPYGYFVYFNTASPNNATNYFFTGQDSTTERIALLSNGGVRNYSANNVNLSDERVKTDIAPLGSMWDKFKAIEIVTFKYKDQTHDDDNIGVIAQQVESVAPEFVDVDGFGETPEDGVPLKSIYTEDLHHAAIKALQEAMTRIEELEAKVAALESK